VDVLVRATEPLLRISVPPVRRGEAVVRARLVLEPDDGDWDLVNAGHVVVAEVVEVVTCAPGWEQGEALAIIDATYLESMTKGGAERRLDRPPVGWPVIVYARREGDAEIASPGG
jgi:hypothetical protein